MAARQVEREYVTDDESSEEEEIEGEENSDDSAVRTAMMTAFWTRSSLSSGKKLSLPSVFPIKTNPF